MAGAVRLYEHPLSPYAQKVKIALREKGVAFDIALPQGLGAGDVAGQFVRANPRAEVPLLMHGQAAIFDSTIILEFIEDTWPTPALLPASPAARARVRMVEEVMDTHFEAINWGLGEIGWFQRASGALAEDLRAAAARQTQGYYAWLADQLGGAAWFNGDTFGWGDLCVVPFAAAAAAMGNRPPEGSPLAAWLTAACERPSVATTLAEARAFDRGASNVPELVAKGLFRREYRDHRLEWMIKSGGLQVVLDGLARDNIRFTDGFTTPR